MFIIDYAENEKPKKITNFDRIKVMSVEEMAVTISALADICRNIAFYGDATVPDLVKKYLESEVQDAD